MARGRAADLAVDRSRVQLAGRTISAAAAQRALSRLAVTLGAHGDLPRVAQSLAIAQSLNRGNSKPDTWPKWARNAVLRYAANPEQFADARVVNLQAWGLASAPGISTPKSKTHSTLHGGQKSKTFPISASRSTAQHIRRVVDIVDLRSPDLLDPGQALDALPVHSAMKQALADAGWGSPSAMSERWLRVALMHSSFMYDHSEIVAANGHLLQMLGSLGSRWFRLFALEEFLAQNPLASANDQSRAWADYASSMVDELGIRLRVREARLLGHGEELISSDPARGTRAVSAVTWQVIGVMCLLGDFRAVAKLARETYAHVVAKNAPAKDWPQILQTHNRTAVTWKYDQSGPDRQKVFHATVTGIGGRKGTGSARTKSGARMAAAEDFVRRYLPNADAGTKSQTRILERHPARAVTGYRKAGGAHEAAVEDLQTIFELPAAAGPLLTQALTHSSWANEHRALVSAANQRDYAPLAHLGSVVADALIAHEQAVRVVSATLTPTEDDARIMTPTEDRLLDLFNDLQLEPGLLVGSVQHDRTMRSVGAGSMPMPWG